MPKWLISRRKKYRMKNIAFILTLLVSTACKVQKPKLQHSSENLIINELDSGVFNHISYLQTESFGKVACNGMVVINESEALVFDTPTDNAASEELINWLENVKKVTVKGVVITHFHDDCLGGISAFHEKRIPSYASNKTIALAKENNLVIPENGFDNSMELTVGNQKVINTFLGEGHTKDNIVSYYPAKEAFLAVVLSKPTEQRKGIWVMLTKPNSQRPS